MKRIDNVILFTTEKATETNIIKDILGGYYHIPTRSAYGNNIFERGVSQSQYADSLQPMHVYIISDFHSPAENDYVYYMNQIQRVNIAKQGATSAVLEHSSLVFDRDKMRKIVATTDPVLIANGVAALNPLFTSLLIDELNNDRQISVVECDYSIELLSDYAIQHLTNEYEWEIDDYSPVPNNFYFKANNDSVFNTYRNGYSLNEDFKYNIKCDDKGLVMPRLLNNVSITADMLYDIYKAGVNEGIVNSKSFQPLNTFLNYATKLGL